MKDYYFRLGIEKTATIEEIKTAYRKLSIKFHPDHNSNDRFFEKRFIEIKEAYDTLSDMEKRKEYDNKYFKENNPNEFANINENSNKKSTSVNNPTMNAPIKSQANNLSRKVIGFIIICLIVLVLSIIRMKASQSINQKAIEDYNGSVKNHSNNLDEIDSSKPAPGENTAVIDIPAKTDTPNIKTVEQKLSTDTMKIYPSKEVTIAWILEKLGSYSKRSIVSTGSFKTINGIIDWSIENNNFNFKFDDNFLIINYDEKHTDDGDPSIQKKKALIPIYDIVSVSSYYIETSEATIQIFDSSNTKYVTHKFDLEIRENAETNLIERIDSAFMNLKRFYKKPGNTETF